MSTKAFFRTHCPHCGKILSVRAELGGRTVACPNPACGKSVTLQAAAETPSVQTAPAEAVDNGGVYDLAEVPLPSVQTSPSKGVGPAAQPLDIENQLQKLRQRHESGALSDEEFATARKALFNGQAKAKKPYLLAGTKRAETRPADALWNLVPDQLQKLLQPVAEYGAGLRRAGNPKLFGDFVASKEGSAADLFKFVAVSIALTSAVEYVLPNGSLIELTASGVVNNLLMMLICALGVLLIATITYKPLRWLGGQGSFHSTSIAAVYVTALYYPILSFLEGLFKFVVYKPITYVNFLLLIPYCLVVARFHKLSVGRTMFIVLGANAPVAVVLLFLMITANKPPGNDAPARSAVAVLKQVKSRVSSKKPSRAEEKPNNHAILPAAGQTRTVQREHADCRQLKLRVIKPKSPAELAAIRGADIDRGRSVCASTDPAEIAEIVGFVAPGFTAKLPVIPGGVAIVEEHFGRTCLLSTHPLDPVRPCILTSTIDVPEGRQTLLTFDVSHSAAGDWRVIVLANGESLYDATVGPKTAPNGWLAVSVDLTRFAGQRVVLELQNKATGYSHEWGWWDNIKINDLEAEPSNEPVPAVAVTPPPAPARSFAPCEEGSRGGEERDDNALNMKLCWCPAGSFRMGSPAGEAGRMKNEGPPVDVTLSRGFWMGKTEVTQSQWQKLMGTSMRDQQDKVLASVFAPQRTDQKIIDRIYKSSGEGPDYPMYNVNEAEAAEFCRKLTTSERAAGRLGGSCEYRLPTEAQWEYACRAGTTTATAFGDRLGKDQANFDWMTPYRDGPKDPNHKWAFTVPVGRYRPNAWGLLDMHGNVWEWCRDQYAVKLAGGRDPQGPPPTQNKASGQVLRGGSWSCSRDDCRSGSRGYNTRGTRLDGTGFRVALVPSE